MGHGAWAEGKQKTSQKIAHNFRETETTKITNAQCPMPNAQCPMPNT
ncbi:MAG: hypothetical protein V7K98_15690 [Nostoc sp.]